MMKYAKGTDQMGNRASDRRPSQTKIWLALNATPESATTRHQVPAGDMPTLAAKRTCLRQEHFETKGR